MSIEMMENKITSFIIVSILEPSPKYTGAILTIPQNILFLPELKTPQFKETVISEARSCQLQTYPDLKF